MGVRGEGVAACFVWGCVHVMECVCVYLCVYLCVYVYVSCVLKNSVWVHALCLIMSPEVYEKRTGELTNATAAISRGRRTVCVCVCVCRCYQ